MRHAEPNARYLLLWCVERRIPRTANEASRVPGHYGSIGRELATIARELLGGELFGVRRMMHALTADEDVYRGWLMVPDTEMWRDVLRGKGEFPSIPVAELGAHLEDWFERLRCDQRSAQ